MSLKDKLDAQWDKDGCEKPLSTCQWSWYPWSQFLKLLNETFKIKDYDEERRNRLWLRDWAQ
jgi:hypothetical protein